MKTKKTSSPSLFVGKVTLNSLIAVTFLAACSPGPQTIETPTASLGNQITDVVTCPASRSAIFNAYYKAYDQIESEDSTRSLVSLGNLTHSAFENDSAVDISDFKTSLNQIHDIFTQGVDKLKIEQVNQVQSLSRSGDVEEEGSDLHKESDPIVHLVRLELRSDLSPAYTELNRKLDEALAQAQKNAKSAQIDCNQESDNLDEPPTLDEEELSNPERMKAYHPLFGARWTMATAYQSCQSIEIPPMDSSTQDAKGIRQGAKHSDGIGYYREYQEKTSTKPLIMGSHPYLKGQTYGGVCVDQSFKPLVYDYGGRAIEQGTDTLNMFLNNNSSGGALGIDCSAYISAAVAKAGNLYKPGSTNKPYYTRNNSTAFVKSSSWTCYDSIKVTGQNTIQPGDILAIIGHVVMIDEVGADPFGLRFISAKNQCSSINYKNFDFAVIQSSPSKGSVGINRYEAKDYFGESSKMRTAIVAYAKRACESKFDQQVKLPKTSSYNIIRHKGTPECLAPKIKLVNEACIDRCSSLKL